MKQIFVIVFTATLFSCETEAGKNAKLELIKAEKELDSVKRVNKFKIQYANCLAELIHSGFTRNESCDKCKEIYYEGFYYDSLNTVLNENKNLDTLK